MSIVDKLAHAIVSRMHENDPGTIMSDQPEAEEASLRELIAEVMAQPLTETHTTKYIQEVVVRDPDSGGDVSMEVHKVEGGGMFAIDSSFLEQVTDTIPSPFDDGVVLRLGELET
jgi:hypothetical protein